jgi:hypothetical protein
MNAFIEWYNTVDPLRALIRSGVFKRLKMLSGADYLWMRRRGMVDKMYRW